MPRILLPPGCAGFADGNQKYMAERGPGSFVNIDDTDPVGKRALQKLQGQDYAQAGLVTGEEKFFVRKGPEGRWCCGCNSLWHSWTKVCSRCDLETIPEGEMSRDLPGGQYVP
jgi:hypothetical protein